MPRAIHLRDERRAVEIVGRPFLEKEDPEQANRQDGTRRNAEREIGP